VARAECGEQEFFRIVTRGIAPVALAAEPAIVLVFSAAVIS